MSIKDFLLPDLGEGLTEGEIVSWQVAVGDRVEVDQPVAEIETAKAVVEVPSPFEGVVATLHAEVGGEVEVGKPLMSIEIGGEPASADADSPGATPDEAEVSDMVPEAKDDGGQSGNVLVGYGTQGGRARRRRGQPSPPADAPPADVPAPAAAPAPAGSPGNGRPLAKPPVRKLAKDLGVDLAEVAPSGPDGVITRADVRAHAEAGAASVPASEDYQGLLAGTAPAEAPQGAGETQRIPLRGIRKRIAEKMTVSRREIPEAVTWVDCDATELMGLRAELNASQERVKVSPLALVLRAVVAGLREFPDLNARLDTDAGEIVRQHFVNLGFAAQTDRGLVVPVIHGADRLSTLGIAEELNRLAAAARDGSLAPEQMSQGTFTVSNYGSFGVDGGSAVINHPEAAILGMGRISERPWVVDGAVAVRRVCQLSIAFDHRICDGGEAAGFLRFVADCVENRATMLGAL